MWISACAKSDISKFLHWRTKLPLGGFSLNSFKWPHDRICLQLQCIHKHPRPQQHMLSPRGTLSECFSLSLSLAHGTTALLPLWGLYRHLCVYLRVYLSVWALLIFWQSLAFYSGLFTVGADLLLRSYSQCSAWARCDVVLHNSDIHHGETAQCKKYTNFKAVAPNACWVISYFALFWAV